MIRPQTNDSPYKLAQLKGPLKQKSSVVDARAYEYMKCRANPLYFSQTYVHVEETGGALKLTPNLMHNKVRRVVRSLVNYHRCVFMASRQLGKALSLDTLIPLYNGKWTSMGNIKVGDMILDENNIPTDVIAATDIMYNHSCYKIDFENADSIIADADHLWKIRFNNKEVIYKTVDIKRLINQKLKIQIDKKDNEPFVIKSITKTKSVPVRCIQVSGKSKLFLVGKQKIPTHNSTIAAIMLEWALIFYPRIECVILNFQKDAALKNLDRIKFIHGHLPDWMQIPPTSKSDIKTYFTLRNGSKVQSFYPTTTHDPSTMARSLTIPILYIDEAAFIPHMDKIYSAAQPTLSKAREQATKHGYPYFQLITSTPNGIYGSGEWFYKRYSNGIESDELFTQLDTGFENWSPHVNIDQKLLDTSKNSFIRVSYHWSEDPSKSEKWYNEQVRELDDERKVNQELDLIFVGASNCIFSDNILGQFKKQRKYEIVNFHRSQTDMKIFKEWIDPMDYYIIGVDSASSTKGAFDSIEIFSFKNFEQVAEINVKLGSLTKYGELVDDVFQWLYKIVNDRIILAIENNSIGKSIVEHLMYHPENDFNYLPFLYKEPNAKEIGINTNTKTKELMIANLYDEIKNNPTIVKSETLIAQLSTIERSNSGTIASKSYSDLFMASCFCAYARKRKNLEIMPLLDYSSEDLATNFLQEISDAAKFSDPKIKMKEDSLKEEYLHVPQQQSTYSNQIDMLFPFSDNDETLSGNNFF